MIQSSDPDSDTASATAPGTAPDNTSPRPEAPDNPSPRPEPPPAALPTSRIAALANNRWWLLPLALIAGFVLLLWQVKAHGPVTGLDIRVRDRVQDWAALPELAWLAAPGRDLANLGNQPIALPVLFAATAVATRATRSWWPAWVMLAAIGALLTVIPLKIAIGRPGPGQVALGDANLGFFPSGHTADAAICYGTAALLLCAVVPLRRTTESARTAHIRRAIGAVAAALIALTIFGLLWSDYHWLSDTVASLCWCGAALLLLRRLISRLQEGSERHSYPG